MYRALLRSVSEHVRSVKKRRGQEAVDGGVENSYDVLKNVTRRKIMMIIRERGFTTFNDLWREIGCSKATVSWHLQVLKKFRLISDLAYSKYKIIYVAGSERRLLAALANWDPRICYILRDLCLGYGVSDIAKRYRLRISSVESIRKLAERLGIFGGSPEDCLARVVEASQGLCRPCSMSQ